MTVNSWLSPKTLKDLPSEIDRKGFFAKAPIVKGEIVAIKMGHIIDKSSLDNNRSMIRDSEMQIADDLFLAPLTDEEFAGSMVYFNHSCEPNCGVVGTNMYVAMRDIAANEELTFDYAMHYSVPSYSMKCNCKTPSCRHLITGNDWKIPELQQKYKGYFSWYLGDKIKDLQKPPSR